MYTKICALKGVVNVKEYAPPTTTVPLPVDNQHILTEQFYAHKTQLQVHLILIVCVSSFV